MVYCAGACFLSVPPSFACRLARRVFGQGFAETYVASAIYSNSASYFSRARNLELFLSLLSGNFNGGSNNGNYNIGGLNGVLSMRSEMLPFVASGPPFLGAASLVHARPTRHTRMRRHDLYLGSGCLNYGDSAYQQFELGIHCAYNAHPRIKHSDARARAPHVILTPGESEWCV